MNLTPTPTQRTKLLDPEVVLHHRRLFCPEYDACLDVAVVAGWTSWTCERCALAAVREEPLSSFLVLAEACGSPFEREHSVAAGP